MQSRLTRNTSEAMLAGVASGLGEYFSIDPIIVRLIFVLTTLTSGIGIPIYLLLWILMPRQKYITSMPASSHNHASQGQPHIGQDAAHVDLSVAVSQPAQHVHHQRVAGEGTGTETEASPNPASYTYDPQTGERLRPEPGTAPHRASIGQTIKLDPGTVSPATPVTPATPAGASSSAGPASYSTASAPGQGAAHSGKHQHTPRTQSYRRRSWRKLGTLMIGLGILFLLQHIGISMSVLVPTIMIVAGAMLLKRNR